MLKVIAEDFIKPEFIETVLPLYRELISATKKEPHCIASVSYTHLTLPTIYSV